MEHYILHVVRMSERQRVSDPRIKSYRYHAMNYKTINSMAMIYILPAPARPLVILHRPSRKSANN